MAIWSHEQLFELFKAEVQAIADASKPGGHPWYQEETFKFQFGYSLTYNSQKGKYEYLVDDPASRVVKRCAVVEVGAIVRIKVAGLVGSTVTPLTAAETTALIAYWNKVGLPGVNVVVTTGAPDLLKLSVTVYYDPLVLSNTGELLSTPGVFPAEDAANGYISNIEFNGKMILTKLVDAMQAAEGVVNPVLHSADAKYGALPYAPIAVEYIPDAGHMILDPAVPINTQFTYLPA